MFTCSNLRALNQSYVGYTNNLKKRLDLHNSGKGAKFTRGRKWILIYKEKFKSKNEAISREYYIKNNRNLREQIIKKNIYENFNFITLQRKFFPYISRCSFYFFECSHKKKVDLSKILQSLETLNLKKIQNKI